MEKNLQLELLTKQLEKNLAKEGTRMHRYLTTLNLLSHFDVKDFEFKKIKDYVLRKIKEDEIVDLEDARFTSENGEQKDLRLTDVFEFCLDGYEYYGVIQSMGCYEEMSGYRLFVFDGYSRPIICNHKGLGKLFDYCEDDMAIFFVHPNEATPVQHLMNLIELADELEDAAYGYFDFNEPLELTRAEVDGNNVKVYDPHGMDKDEQKTVEEVVVDLLILDRILRQPKPEDFHTISKLITQHDANEVFAYEGINPVNCQWVSVLLKEIENLDHPKFAYKVVFEDLYNTLKYEDVKKEEVVDGMFYVNTHLQVCPMTTNEVKILAEALKIYLKWYYELEVIQVERKIV